mgnify:FL=1
MNSQTGVIAIVGVCALILLMGAVRKKKEWLLNLVLRTVFGTLAVLSVNMMMEKAGMTVVVGLNPVTLLTSAFLGFPGLAALYGVQFYKLL